MIVIVNPNALRHRRPFGTNARAGFFMNFKQGT